MSQAISVITQDRRFESLFSSFLEVLRNPDAKVV